MKAHVRKSSQQPKETVLLYHLEPEKENKARQVLENCGAKVITAGLEDSEQTLGALLGMDGFPRFDGEPSQKVESEAILFSGSNILIHAESISFSNKAQSWVFS